MAPSEEAQLISTIFVFAQLQQKIIEWFLSNKLQIFKDI